MKDCLNFIVKLKTKINILYTCIREKNLSIYLPYHNESMYLFSANTTRMPISFQIMFPAIELIFPAKVAFPKSVLAHCTPKI